MDAGTFGLAWPGRDSSASVGCSSGPTARRGPGFGRGRAARRPRSALLDHLRRPRAGPTAKRSMSASVVTSVAQTSSASRRSGSSGYQPASGRPARTPRSSRRRWTAGASGDVDRELVQDTEPLWTRGAPAAASAASSLRALARAARRPRRAARADRAWRRRPWRRARTAPGWCRCCWPPCRAGCPVRARAASSRRRVRPSRSIVRPTSRPGTCRTSRSRAARRPRYGPPYCSGDAQRLALADGDVGAVLGRAAPGRRVRPARRRPRTARRRRARVGRPRPSARARRRRWAGRAARPRPGRAGSASARSSAARSVVPSASVGSSSSARSVPAK